MQVRKVWTRRTLKFKTLAAASGRISETSTFSVVKRKMNVATDESGSAIIVMDRLRRLRVVVTDRLLRLLRLRRVMVLRRAVIVTDLRLRRLLAVVITDRLRRPVVTVRHRRLALAIEIVPAKSLDRFFSAC